jgi:hypothetical protein
MDSRKSKSSEKLLELNHSTIKDYVCSEKLIPSIKGSLPQKTVSTSRSSEKPANREKIFEPEVQEERESEDEFKRTAECFSDVAFENRLLDSKKVQDKISYYLAEWNKELFGPLPVFESDKGEGKHKLENAISTHNSRAEDISLMKDLILKVPDKITELPAAPISSNVFEKHSRYPKSFNKTLTKVSNRKIARSKLQLVKILNEKARKEVCEFSIRLWKDMDGMPFYDCSCDGRMPGSLSSITTIVLDVPRSRSLRSGTSCAVSAGRCSRTITCY